MEGTNGIRDIDINCDVGEGIGNEAQLFPLIASCNIACGGHAGDNASMREAVKLAKESGVKVGVHPSYPDREHFGRLSMDISVDLLVAAIRYQVGQFLAILEEEGVKLHHIKPHGALYNDIAGNRAKAKHFLEAIEPFTKDVFLYVPYGSIIAQEAYIAGISIKHEAFADRNYNLDLSLVSRTDRHALIQDPQKVLEHLLFMVEHQMVLTCDGTSVALLAETFCVHGDTPNALQILMYLSEHLPNHMLRIAK